MVAFDTKHRYALGVRIHLSAFMKLSTEASIHGEAAWRPCTRVKSPENCLPRLYLAT